ncbi:MAG: AIR synthase related protein [Bacillota bacterium]
MSINRITSFRDLTLVPLGSNEILVIACDSLGGIGPKAKDNVKTPADVVGKYTARVPLMEVLACGASPFVVVNTLSVEMEPTGAGFIKGIQEEIRMAGFPSGIAVTGSTEENTTTCQSGLGVTVIGKATNSELRLGQSRAGDLVVCLGRPKNGTEVLDGTAKADPALVKKLLAVPCVREILPVGSRGVLYEAELLAQCSGNRLVLSPSPEIDLKKSAGPSTCILVSVEESDCTALRELTELPLFIVGSLVKI